MAYIGKEPIVGNFQKCDAITVVNGQAAYTLQVSSTNVVPESANHMLVSLNGILQAPVTSFTVSGSTLTFASNLATGDVIDFVILLGNVLDLGVPSDDTVGAAQIKDDLISGTTALASEPADTDEFLVSDAGTLKRIDYSLIKASSVWTKIKTQTITSSTADMNFIDGSSDVVFDSTYKMYVCILNEWRPVTDGTALKVQITTDGGSSYETSGYVTAANEVYHGGSATSADTINTDSDSMLSSHDFGNASSELGAATIWFPNPSNSSSLPYCYYQCMDTKSNQNYIRPTVGGGRYDTATAYNGFKLKFASGNINEGIATLYGLTT